MIERGYIYIAQPPLYKISKGKKSEYAYDESEKERVLKEFGVENEKPESDPEKPGKKSGVNIQRYKGLGEMNAIQLWETTMNPENRVFLKVGIDDAEKADQTFSMLMGSEVAPRKRFIQTRAKLVKNLDI